jgi:hypothetical protein
LPVVRIFAIACSFAALLAATAASADSATRAASAAPVSAESQEGGRDKPAQHPSTGSFKRDVKQAWADAGDGFRKTGRAIGDGARAFGRATRDAAVGTWRGVKDAFTN